MKKALDLSRSIDEYRWYLNHMAMNKGISDPEVLRLSQKLDEKIIMLQKILYKPILKVTKHKHKD